LAAVFIKEVGPTNQGRGSIVGFVGSIGRGILVSGIVIRRRRLRRGLPLLRLLPLLRRPCRGWCWLVAAIGDVERVHWQRWVIWSRTDVADRVIVQWVLVLGVSKDGFPFNGVEVWELFDGGGDSSEPIIKDNVKVAGDGSGCGIQSDRDGTGVTFRVTHVDLSKRSRLPSRELESVCDLLVQGVKRATPDMEVVELGMRPTLLGEQVVGGQSWVFPWHVVVEEHSVIHSHWPELGIGNVGPVYCCMQQ
jgi:hypothetical protein